MIEPLAGIGIIEWGAGPAIAYAGKLLADLGAGVTRIETRASASGDLIAGRVHIYFSTIPAALAQMQAGKLRALAVTTLKRVNLIQDIPTVAESGLPGFEVIGWFGIFAPAGTPKPIVAKLNKEVNQAFSLPETQQRFAAQGLIPGGGTPEELGRFLRAEIAKWGALIKDAGIQGS